MSMSEDGPRDIKLDLNPVFEANELKVKSKKYITIGNKVFYAVIIGCMGKGELLLLDSIQYPSEYERISLEYPDLYATIGDIVDLNGDGRNELPLYFSSGSHGQYVSIISFNKKQTIKFTDDKGNSLIFSPSGLINIKDMDGDGIDEVISGDLLGENRIVRTIYSWKNDEFSNYIDTVTIKK